MMTHAQLMEPVPALKAQGAKAGQVAGQATVGFALAQVTGIPYSVILGPPAGLAAAIKRRRADLASAIAHTERTQAPGSPIYRHNLAVYRTSINGLDRLEGLGASQAVDFANLQGHNTLERVAANAGIGARPAAGGIPRDAIGTGLLLAALAAVGVTIALAARGR